MPQPIFSLKNVNHESKGKKLLIIKKFEMHRGATYVVDGNMGSGKTALIDILSRNIKVNSGDCEYEQKKLSSYSSRMYNDQVAVVPQTFKAPFGTVGKYLKKTLKKYSHISDPNRMIEDICRKMEIEHLLDRKMRELSPGQLRWVVLSANIAADTKVLLIDEIEQHLSRNNLNQLVKLLYRKSNYDGVTIVVTTQNKDSFSQRLASVTLTLESGRITSVRSANKKRKNYSHKK
ncbi:MAG: ABC transporter ATP-binding protein [Candidatus Marinimicrobia bacterium]|nr:ABC transporter ATP-binding protein [Candidatus Neomarinimicrobiota bacterium]